jgi:glycerophosphoryl diester phosphodiesterase
MDWGAGTGLRIGGHRGASAVAPENTFAAFELAFASGATYVELDVQLSHDGQPMVIHDGTLERTTNGHGAVSDHTAIELGGLDAGSWFGPEFRGERVPSLSGFLAWLEPQTDRGAIIEAKAPGSGRLIAEAIRGSAARQRLALCSFEDAEIRVARSVLRDLRAVRISSLDAIDEQDPLAVALRSGANGIDAPSARLDPDAVARLREAGLFVSGGTALDPQAFDRCRMLALDAVNANDPAMVVAAAITRDPA